MSRRSILLWFVLTGIPFLACAALQPAGSRKQVLQDELRQFHVSLLSQAPTDLVRPLRARERETWQRAWDCYFQRFRVIDYVIDSVRFQDDATRAEVSLRVSCHALNALATRQQTWRESWVHDRNRWRLEVKTEALREILGECYPEVPTEKHREP